MKAAASHWELVVKGTEVGPGGRWSWPGNGFEGKIWTFDCHVMPLDAGSLVGDGEITVYIEACIILKIHM